MVPWWFSSIVLMCFARCAVTRRPSPAAPYSKSYSKDCVSDNNIKYAMYIYIYICICMYVYIYIYICSYINGKSDI